jgi:hypothetical protein
MGELGYAHQFLAAIRTQLEETMGPSLNGTETRYWVYGETGRIKNSPGADSARLAPSFALALNHMQKLSLGSC